MALIQKRCLPCVISPCLKALQYSDFIGRYMYSRAKMRQYQISYDMESIGMEAAQFLRKNRTGGEVHGITGTICGR